MPHALMQVIELDGDNPYQEVIFSAFTGGAHCCNHTTVLSNNSIGVNWNEIVLGRWWDGANKQVVSVKRGKSIFTNS